MDSSRTWVVESRHDLRLVSAGHKPRRVARIIAGVTGRTRPEARGMIETAPVLILQGASYATAERARRALERRGAMVEVRTSEVETAGQPPQPSTPPTTVWTIVAWGFLILFLILIILVIVGTFDAGQRWRRGRLPAFLGDEQEREPGHATGTYISTDTGCDGSKT